MIAIILLIASVLVYNYIYYQKGGNMMGIFSQLFHRDQRKKKYIYITGMVCQNCSDHVKEALKSVPGVAKVTVDLSKGMAMVVLDGEVGNDILFKTIVQAGYTVTEVLEQPK